MQYVWQNDWLYFDNIAYITEINYFHMLIFGCFSLHDQSETTVFISDQLLSV